MCGIAGIFDLKGHREIDENQLVVMRDSMITRGPDEAGTYRRDGVGLAHRRLSIIDIKSGQQPLLVEDGRVAITFNGEIYNFREIAKELKTRGHVFKSNSDTEVIARAWLEWGASCVDRLRGMFAFAIYDGRQQSIFLARDRLGIKPLYYACTDDGFLVFGSEIKALVSVPKINLSLNKKSVENYFALGYVPDPDSIYSGIHKIEPGHLLKAECGSEPKLHRYWDVEPEAVDAQNTADVSKELIERLSEAVGIRLVAEVPLGAFLSGGVDSSAIVSLMSKLLDDKVKTCSMSFAEASHDESSYASIVANHCSTEHYSEVVDGNETQLVSMLADIYGEPFADSSAIPTLQVCRLARKHVTVALSGDGADELLAGYRRQRLHMNEEKVRQMLPFFLRSRLFGPVSRFYPKADWAPQVFRAKTTLQALANNSIDAYLDTVSHNPAWIRRRLFSARFLADLDGFTTSELFRRHALDAPSDDPLELIQYLDLKTYLPGGILTKVDRASMACSLEVRVPFLDHNFVNWCFGLNAEHKLSGGVGKIALKRAMEPYLPNEILYRQKKGFGVPLAEWIRGPLRQTVKEALCGEQLRDTGFFNVGFLDSIVQEHNSRRQDHSTLIWSLLMFDGFLSLGYVR